MKFLPRTILLCGCLACLLVGLFPPWAFAPSGGSFPLIAYRYVFAPPPIVGDLAYSIDRPRLVARILFVAAATSATFLVALLAGRRQRRAKPDV